MHDNKTRSYAYTDHLKSKKNFKKYSVRIVW